MKGASTRPSAGSRRSRSMRIRRSTVENARLRVRQLAGQITGCGQCDRIELATAPMSGITTPARA
jgi:hypothetical protein